MNKYIVTVDTNWCGTNQTYYVESDDYGQVCDWADQMAYDNFLGMNGPEMAAEDLGLDDYPDLSVAEQDYFDEETAQMYWADVYEFEEKYEEYSWQELIEMSPDNHYMMDEE